MTRALRTVTPAPVPLEPVRAPQPQAVVYLRVSSKRQMDTAADVDPEGNSIATQREFCLAKARKVDATVVREFVEPGNSAQTIEKRPVFRELLAFLTENPGVDYVIIYMRSRAFRNLGDAVVTKRRLARMDIRLLSAKEDFGEGIMADAMEAVTDIINEVQVRMSGEDIRVKMRHKAENGGTISRARLGYKNVRVEYDGRMVNTVGLDADRAPLVRTAWELYSTGEYSIERLYATMADLGLTTRPSRRSPAQPLAASQLHRMLSDPYYTGVVVYQGEIFAGRHDAIVSQELFDRVQTVLEHRSARGQRDRVLRHYLKGLLFCDRCQKAGRTSRLIYTEAKGRGGVVYEYYLCRGRQDGVCTLPHLPLRQVEDVVTRYYGLLQLTPDFLAETSGLVEAVMRDEQQTVRDLQDGFRKQLRSLDVKEERLLDLAADGELPREKIHARLRQVQIERGRATQGLKETGRQLVVGAEVLQTYLRLLDQPRELYGRASDDARRELNLTFFERLFLDDRGVVEAVLTEPMVEFQDGNRAFGLAMQGKQKKEGEPVLTDRLSLDDRTVLSAVFLDGGSSKTLMVGVTGFEPATSSSRTTRATKLRHTPWPKSLGESSPSRASPPHLDGRSGSAAWPRAGRQSGAARTARCPVRPRRAARTCAPRRCAGRGP